MSLPSTTTSDLELVERARAGDRLAFGELVLRHDEQMRGLAFRLLADRDAMDDALQVAYLELYRGLHTLRPGSDIGRWIYRVAYNACIDELRRRGRQPIGASSGSPGASNGTSEAVRQALADLPVAQRITVVMVDGEDFERDAVAEILGVTPATVTSRLNRARAALRGTLRDALG